MNSSPLTQREFDLWREEHGKRFSTLAEDVSAIRAWITESDKVCASIREGCIKEQDEKLRKTVKWSAVIVAIMFVLHGFIPPEVIWNWILKLLYIKML
jgi:hypothetical protein